MKKSTRKPGITKAKSLTESINSREISAIYETLSNNNKNLKNTLESLSRLNLGKLWQITCDLIENLPPVSKQLELPSSSTDAPEIQNLDYEEKCKIVIFFLMNVFPLAMTKNLVQGSFSDEMYIVLNTLFDNNVYQTEISKIANIIWKKQLTGREKIAERALNNALEKVISNRDNCSKMDVKCLLMYKDVLADKCEFLYKQEVNKKLISCVSCLKILEDASCYTFLHNLFFLDIDTLLNCQRAVIEVLQNPETTKQHARVFGKVYGMLCHHEDDPRFMGVLTNNCLQPILSKFIKIMWDVQSKTMIPIGYLLQEILLELHAYARGHDKVMETVTTAYNPILWRHVSSYHSCYRINASMILLDLFPIDSRDVNDSHDILLKQYRAILKMLMDQCALVRAVAAKKVCEILSLFWDCIPPWFKTDCFKCLLTRLAFDHSSEETRIKTLEGLTFMLTEGDFKVKLQIAPKLEKLKPLFFDKSKRVVHEFVKLLIALQNIRHPSENFGLKIPNFWNIVEPRDIINQIGKEEKNSILIRSLVTLLYPSIHPADKGKEVLMRAGRLIARNYRAALIFYQHSDHVLNGENVIKFMQKVMHWLGIRAKEKRLGRNKKGKDRINSVTKDNLDVQNIESNDKSSFNPVVVRGFLEIIFILWMLHSKELIDPDRKKQADQLILISSESIIELYKTWKGNYVLMNVLVNLGGLCPPGKVRMLVSYCQSQLRGMFTKNNLTRNELSLENNLLAMCNWNASNEIIELLTECITLNIKNALPNKSPKKGKGVNFENTSSLNAEVALQVIKTLLSDLVMRNGIFQKSYKPLKELVSSFRPITHVIDYRLEKGSPLSQMDDNLIHLLFQRYVALITIMQPTPQCTFNISLEYSHLIKWASKKLQSYVFPTLVNNKQPLAALIIQDLSVDISAAIFCLRLSAETIEQLVSFSCQLKSEYLFISVFLILSSILYQLVCEFRQQRENLIKDRVSIDQIFCLICDILEGAHNSYAVDICMNNVKSYTLEDSIEEMIKAVSYESNKLPTFVLSYWKFLLNLIESSIPDSEIELLNYKLPPCVVTFLHPFLTADLPSHLLSDNLIAMVYQDYANREKGRLAVAEIFRLLKVSKYADVLTVDHMKNLNLAVEACENAAIDVDERD